MRQFAIGYVVTVFYDGEATKFKYAGSGEWEFVSGCNSPARYEQLMELIS